MRLAGEAYAPRSPAEAVALGVGFLTEDRKAEGLLLNLEIAPNLTAPKLGEITTRGLLDRARELAIAREEIANYAIAAPSARARMINLSGGNQQKTLFGRWVRACHRVLILDEPTRGVDVGAKVEIYRIIRRLAESGLGVIMISSELLEILGMCDRILVMREGRISGELGADEASEQRIMALAAMHPVTAIETAS
jgi:ABC-type sugar transport system ATPase subunit